MEGVEIARPHALVRAEVLEDGDAALAGLWESLRRALGRIPLHCGLGIGVCLRRCRRWIAAARRRIACGVAPCLLRGHIRRGGIALLPRRGGLLRIALLGVPLLRIALLGKALLWIALRL